MVETRVLETASVEREQATRFVKYSFFKVDRAWRRLASSQRSEHKAEFLAAARRSSGEVALYSYTTLGLRGDVDFLLWTGCFEMELLPRFHAALLGTGLGGYLDTPHSYLGITRRSPYLGGHRHEGQEGARRELKPAGSRYLFVYPFVKTHEWFQLAEEERLEMMRQHFQIGHRYPGVQINTTYSFGLDDQEHIVAFEADDPEEWMECVMELRSAKTRPYTLRDTPIFSCIRMELEEVLDLLG